MRIHRGFNTMGALILLPLFWAKPVLAQKASWEYIKGLYGGTVTSLLADRQGNLFAGTTKEIFRSTNGGGSWVPSASFTPYPGAFIIDSSGTVLAGSTGLWRSTDAGVSWSLYGYSEQSVEFLTVSPSGDVYAGINSPQTRGVFPLENPDWISQWHDISSSFKGVSFIDGNTGIVVGDAGEIVRTTNGGTTWTSQVSGTTSSLMDVRLLDANVAIAVGSTGTIIRTTDGGTHWTAQTSGTSEHLQGLCFADSLHGTVVGLNGTILHTTDGGVTWTSQKSGTTHWLYAVSFSDSNTGTAVGQGVYLHGTILRTSDGGATWTDQTWSETPPLYGVCFINGDTGTAVGNGILRTTDGGTTWTSQPSGFNGTLSGVSFIDANTGAAVGLAGTVLRTIDGGEHWIRLSNATDIELTGTATVDANTCVAVGVSGAILRLRIGRAAMVPAGLSGRTINGLLFSKKHGLLAITDGSSIYRCSWTDTNWTKIATTRDWPIEFAEDASGNLFVGFEVTGVTRSTDGGITWDSVGLIQGQTGYSFASLPSGELYAGVAPLDPSIDGGVYVSSDGGTIWESRGLKDWPIYKVLAQDASQIFLGSQRGVFKSTSGGNSWEVTSAGITAGSTLSLLAVDSTTLLAGTDFGLFRSSDNGTNWEESSEGILPHGTNCLAADSSGNLFAGNIVFTTGGIFKSSDQGRTWKCTTKDSITSYYAAIHSIVVTSKNTVLACVGNDKWWICRSTDHGEIWKPVAHITNWRDPNAFALDRAGNIYGATMDHGVLRSTDDGVGWTYVNAGISDLNLRCVTARDSGEVCAGGLGGAFRSTDAGFSWAKISTSLGDIIVSAIAFDAGGDLVIATYAGEIYRTTDGGISWTKDAFPGSNRMIHSLSTHGGQLFAADSNGVLRCSRSTTSVKFTDGLRSGSANLEQNYPNPYNPSTTIRFTIAGSREYGVGSRETKLVVYDILGREVAVLVNEKKAPGSYEVRFDAAGLSSGVYFYRLQAGGFVQTKKFVVLR